MFQTTKLSLKKKTQLGTDVTVNFSGRPIGNNKKDWRLHSTAWSAKIVGGKFLPKMITKTRNGANYLDFFADWPQTFLSVSCVVWCLGSRASNLQPSCPRTTGDQWEVWSTPSDSQWLVEDGPEDEGVLGCFGTKLEGRQCTLCRGETETTSRPQKPSDTSQFLKPFSSPQAELKRKRKRKKTKERKKNLSLRST